MYLNFCLFTYPLPFTKNKALISSWMFVSKILKYSKLHTYMIFGFFWPLGRLCEWLSINVWHNISRIYNGKWLSGGLQPHLPVLQGCVQRGVSGTNPVLPVWLSFPHKGLSEHQLGKVDSLEGWDNRNEIGFNSTMFKNITGKLITDFETVQWELFRRKEPKKWAFCAY